MNLAKPNVSKKAVLIILAVAILGYLAGSGATYLALKDRLVSENQRPGSSQNTDTSAGNSKLESNIPEGTVSPTAIMKTPDEYKDKETKVRGLVVESGDNKYIIAGQETTDAGSVELDLSKAGDIKISDFIAAFSDPKKAQSQQGSNSPATSGPVTATGVVNVSSDGKLTLAVTKIEK